MRNRRVMKFKEVDRVTDSLNTEVTTDVLVGCKPGEPLCRKNGKLNIIRTSPSGNTHFVQVLLKGDKGMVPAPGAYFVLPDECYLPDTDMPFDFLHEVNWHKRASGMVFDNGGFNYTKEGGGLLPHAHFWLMQVQPGDKPRGLYTLRTDYRQQAVELAEARNALSRRRTGW